MQPSVVLFAIAYIFVWDVSAQKPIFTNYMLGDGRTQLAEWLLTGFVGIGNITETNAELPGYDGWYNNLARPDSGAIDRPLLRRWPAAYEDGTYLPSGSDRPNPIDLSEQLLNGPIGSRSRTGKNALLVFFGQQVVEEILDAQRPACPPEYFNIPIPENHRYRNLTKHTQMPLLRTRFDQRTGINPNNPRQQLNEITPYLDGGLMYGITKQWADQLRTYSNGTVDGDGLLAYSEGGLFPEKNTRRLPMANPPPPFHHADIIKNHELFKVNRFFQLGNPRGNENTFLLTFGVLWFRWHNYLARNIRAKEPDWPSEKVFNEARKWVIATQQHIVMYEWLPSWIEPSHIPTYKEYDPSINPQIDQFFQAAAFRFGHTLVTPGVYMRDYGRNGCGYNFKNILGTNAIRTCNAFWRPQDAILSNYSNNPHEYMDIDRLLMGMSYQLCEEEDHKIVEDLRGNVFGPIEFPRRDLMAVNIQRGRDHGLPDFNSARRAYGLNPIRSFNHFNVTPDIRAKLASLYQTVDKIDVWVGGILETRDGPGELFEKIIIDQFRRIRDGDRFWYENKANNLFTNEEIQRIKQLNLYDIIMAVTKLDPMDIQKKVFRVPRTETELHPTCMSNNITIETNCTERNIRTACFHLPILNVQALNESCKDGTSYDYFSNSEASFIITFTALGTIIVGFIGLIYLLVHLKKVQRNVPHPVMLGSDEILLAKEWVDFKDTSRHVLVAFNEDKKLINITCTNLSEPLRTVDCSRPMSYIKTIDKPYLIIKAPHEYDLVLKFPTQHVRDLAFMRLNTFVSRFSKELQEEQQGSTLEVALKTVVTVKTRQKQLEQFFRVIFAQAHRITHNSQEMMAVDANAANVVDMEITRAEFAEMLNMSPNADFVELMFKLVDKDKNGFISFEEFLNLMVVFAQGTNVDIAKLIFDLHDVDGNQEITIDTFHKMIRTYMKVMVDNEEHTKAINQTIQKLLKDANLGNKNKVTFTDFVRILGGNLNLLSNVKLGFKFDVAEKRTRDTIQEIYGSPADIKERFKTGEEVQTPQISTRSKTAGIVRSIQKNSKEIFWLSLYTFVLLAIFAERAYYYSVEREHSGLRRIAGYGVTVTRGAASAMMFTYSSLLVTMCRNIGTKLRDTVVNRYFPLDSLVEIHKYIAYWSLFFTGQSTTYCRLHEMTIEKTAHCVGYGRRYNNSSSHNIISRWDLNLREILFIHIIGHAFNFYHISTQTADDLTCLFRNYFHATHVLPKFHYWCWQTLTGVTGIILTIITAIIFIFAQPIVRRKLYNYFWFTHSLYPLFYIFMILHGAGRLIQEPFFYYFFLGPVILFAIDQTITLSRNKIEIKVTDVSILPSNVTMLKIEKPPFFQYKSGQWVRIACAALNSHEYHPFTISTSPNEQYLTLHIRAVGPWTNNIRKLYENSLRTESILPNIYLDGPYGEGHQDWYKYEVAILTGGGIGVTPFASILKDIVYRANLKNIACKKVYFIWVSKTQKEFEWLLDLLRIIEEQDQNKIIQPHIYITQYYDKFDLRTIMLYIFERYYQHFTNKSLFTNLEATTHFNRPVFDTLFRTFQNLHPQTLKIGAFSCGPPAMISSVDAACFKLNKSGVGAIYEHHYKIF